MPIQSRGISVAIGTPLLTALLFQRPQFRIEVLQVLADDTNKVGAERDGETESCRSLFECVQLGSHICRYINGDPYALPCARFEFRHGHVLRKGFLFPARGTAALVQTNRCPCTARDAAIGGLSF